MRVFLFLFGSLPLFGQIIAPTWYTGPEGRGLWEVGARAQTATEGARVSVQSIPDGADVYLGDTKIGTTPLVLFSIDRGPVKITLKKSSHFSMDIFLNATERADYELKGTLEKAYARIRVDPWSPALVMTVNGSPIATPDAEVSAGRVELKLRKFGYRDITMLNDLEAETVWEVAPVWVEAPFEALDQGVARRTIAPGNPGRMGEFRWAFSVSGPGSGRLDIFSPGNDEEPTATIQLPSFFEWDQEASWQPPLDTPDGDYKARLFLKASSGEEHALETGFTLDASQRFSPGWGDVLSPSILPSDTLQLAWRYRWQNIAEADRAVHEVRFRAGFPWLEFQFGLGIATNLVTNLAELNALSGLFLRPVLLWDSGPSLGGMLGFTFGWSSVGVPSDFPWIASPGLRLALPVSWVPIEGVGLGLEPGGGISFFPFRSFFAPKASLVFFGKEHRLALSGSWENDVPGVWLLELDTSVLPWAGSVLFHINAAVRSEPGEPLRGSFGAGLGLVP